MEKWQQDMFNKLAAYNDSDIRMTMSMGRQTGKSWYQALLAQPFYEVLEDHWEHPGMKRVDVSPVVGEWIRGHDSREWEDTGVIIIGNYHRFIITPQLLTLLILKWK